MYIWGMLCYHFPMSDIYLNRNPLQRIIFQYFNIRDSKISTRTSNIRYKVVRFNEG